MRIGLIPQLISTWYNNPVSRKRSLLFTGKSGVGKSDGVRQGAALLSSTAGWQGVIDIRLSMFTANDMLGLPEADAVKRIVTWLRNEWWPTDPDSSGILFLDEMLDAPKSVLASAYQIALDHMLGQHKLPDGWMVIGAGNPASARGVGGTIPAPLHNRFTEIAVEEHIDDTIDHFALTNRRPEVSAFLKTRADYLHQFGPEYYNKQFPTPRGWAFVSDILDMDLPVSDGTRIEVLAGTVGEKAASDFEQFMRVWQSMPDIDRILTNPATVDVPSALDVRYCIVMGVAARATKKNVHNVIEYMKRMPRELGNLSIKLAYQRDPTLIQSTAFADWYTDNQDVFKR